MGDGGPGSSSTYGVCISHNPTHRDPFICAIHDLDPSYIPMSHLSENNLSHLTCPRTSDRHDNDPARRPAHRHDGMDGGVVWAFMRCDAVFGTGVGDRTGDRAVGACAEGMVM